MEAARVDAFRDAFTAACEEQLGGRTLSASARDAEVRLDSRDDVMALLADLERLEPCGEQNPAPRLLIDRAQVLSAREIKGHLKIEMMLGELAYHDGRHDEAFAHLRKSVDLDDNRIWVRSNLH